MITLAFSLKLSPSQAFVESTKEINDLCLPYLFLTITAGLEEVRAPSRTANPSGRLDCRSLSPLTCLKNVWTILFSRVELPVPTLGISDYTEARHPMQRQESQQEELKWT
jgi:hypothetical protein